jgi:hypothetical protein
VPARGENSIAVFALSGATGEPVLIQSAPIRGIHPRCIDIDAPGQTLIVTTRGKGIVRDGPVSTELPAALTVYAIDGDGHLEEHGRVPVDVSGVRCSGPDTPRTALGPTVDDAPHAAAARAAAAIQRVKAATASSASAALRVQTW